MSKQSHEVYLCKACEKFGEMVLWDSINSAEDPEAKEKVLSGELFQWKCPHCGEVTAVQYPCLYHDPDEKLMIYLLPEGDGKEQQVLELGDDAAFLLSGYRFRSVADPNDLKEKLLIADAGLNDRVVEVCKALIYLNYTQNPLNPPMSDIFFEEKKEGAVHFIFFREGGGAQAASLAQAVYGDIEGALSKAGLLEEEKKYERIDLLWGANAILKERVLEQK